MERGACNGSSTTNKKSSSSNSDVPAAPAAARHSNQPFRLMVGVHRGTNLSRPFEGGGAGGANEALLTHDVVSSCYGGGESFRTSTTTPFDIYSYKSPGEMAAAVAVGFPFTSAQWRELERQAMIFKYMMYSVPVPSDLLFPLARNFPDPPASSLHNMTTHSRNGDPEPGRCKRTDGKKWRCTKDVAPYQKYCERHLHRGRPRSRKPVEPKSSNGEKHNKKTRPVVSSRQAAAVNDHQQQQEPLLLFGGKPDAAVNNGDLGLVVEAEMAGLNVAQQHQQQQWQILMDANMGFTNEGSSSLCDSSQLFEKDYMLGYPNLTASDINAPAGFIDAWSINSSTSIVSDEPPLSTSNHKNVSPSLDLSMAMTVGSILDDEMGSCDRNSSKDLKWLNPVSWEPFAPGGPLAEALHPGSLCTNPASPHDSINTPATTVSSPSGVLQRTFFSHSDSSVCNSPRTFQEVPFYRPN